MIVKYQKKIISDLNHALKNCERDTVALRDIIEKEMERLHYKGLRYTKARIHSVRFCMARILDCEGFIVERKNFLPSFEKDVALYRITAKWKDFLRMKAWKALFTDTKICPKAILVVEGCLESTPVIDGSGVSSVIDDITQGYFNCGWDRKAEAFDPGSRPTLAMKSVGYKYKPI